MLYLIGWPSQCNESNYRPKWNSKKATLHFEHYSMHSYLFAISLDSIPAVSLLFNTNENSGMRSSTLLQLFALFFHRLCICNCGCFGSEKCECKYKNAACDRLFGTSQIFGWIHKLAAQNEIFLWEKFSIYHWIFASLLLFRPDVVRMFNTVSLSLHVSTKNCIGIDRKIECSLFETTQ